METGYRIEENTNSKGGKGNKINDLFRGVDSIFQLAFITGNVWKLVDEIFSMLKNIGIKN